MRKLATIVTLVFMLAGCTIFSPSPSSTSTTPQVTPTPTPSSTATPIVIPAGACLQPSDAAIEWVRTYVNNPSFPANSISVVEAGEGNFASETWDIVAIKSAQTGGTIESFLTNVNSADQPSGVQWIDIGTSVNSSWGSVSWTGTRLTNGQQAQKIAFACLGWQP